jgi:small subunit ribosomal protein S16
MLAIRMQRTGRHGHAMFRMIVQDARRTPTSGNIVALLGSYDPHTKTAVFDKEKASYYLEHGAQPSDRVIFLMKSQGVKLPSWVSVDTKKTASIRNQSKLRRNRPAGEATPVPKVEDEVSTEVETATPASTVDEVDETPVVEATPAEEAASEPAADETTPAPEPTEPEEALPVTDETAPETATTAEEPLEK